MKVAGQPLTGRRALVTGTTFGIGKAVARRLAASVAVNYRSHPKKAKKIVAEIKAAGGKAIAIHADLSKEREIKTLFASLFEEFGAIDILVNSAGTENKSPFLKMPVRDWYQTSFPRPPVRPNGCFRSILQKAISKQCGQPVVCSVFGRVLPHSVAASPGVI